MKTTLTANGTIELPEEIRRADNLMAGDPFDIQRLSSGQYLLARKPSERRGFIAKTGSDGLPVITATGAITSELVSETESQTP